MTESFKAYLKERHFTPEEVARYEALYKFEANGFDTMELALEFMKLELKRATNLVSLGVITSEGKHFPTFNVFD